MMRGLLSVFGLALALTGLAHAKPEVLPFEPNPEGGGPAMVELFKKHYGEQEVETSSSLALNRWNAFKYLQFALAEMMVDPAESDKSREEYGRSRNVNDGMGPQPKGWSYMYWNRGDLGDTKVPLADQSGSMIRATDFPSEIGMEGKNIYMPDSATLDKLLEVLKQQQELGQKMGPSDGQPQEQIDEYTAKASALEQQFLELVGAEIPKLSQLTAGGKKVYALGYKYDDKDQPSPLELNVPMIRSRLTRMGVPIKEDGAAGPTSATTDPVAQGPRTPITEPAIRVRQSAQTVQEFNLDYEALNQPEMTESQRTAAEIQRDMFRMRTRAKDMNSGAKTYDLLMSPELPTGGLNLPSKLPQDQ